MVQAWDSVISDHLNQVDAVMQESIQSRSAELTEICAHVIKAGGKRMRPGICILSFLAAGGDDPRRIIRTAAAFEMIHNATLIHDDINDQSEIRRGAVTAHRKYTVPKALIAGDFLFVQGFRLGGAMDEAIVDAIAEASVAMAESEFTQADFEHVPEADEAVYERIIEGKTARPIEAGARVGSYLAGASAEVMEGMGHFALNIGLAFQIADDILDVEGDKNKTGKRPGIDIMEGKPTLPIIYAMQDPVHGPRIREIFQARDISDALVDEALELIQKTDSLDRCRQRASHLVQEARQGLALLPPSIYRDSLEALADYVVVRNH